jgi:hypothetical protein
MRFRPRFSVRTLTIFVTLVCAYFGAWEATKRYVRSDRSVFTTTPGSPPYVMDVDSPMPLLVCRDEVDYFYHDDGRALIYYPRRYYVWLFGPTVRLPIQLSWHQDAGTFIDPARQKFDMYEWAR